VTPRRMTLILVEDEPEARLNLHEFLRGVGEAVELLERLRPDLVLLDVQLPVRSGLEVLRRLTFSPDVVFTTAHDQHAVTAFELGALDFLVKPFGRQRLLAALERVRARRGGGGPGPGAGDAERMRLALESTPLERLFVRQGNRIVPVPAKEIIRVSAAGDYAEVHTRAGSHLLRLSLRDLALRLDPARFIRVHRSHVINLDAVEVIEMYDERRVSVKMTDGAEVVASRAASETLKNLAR
jgi:two-component system LytT family response regulator